MMSQLPVPVLRILLLLVLPLSVLIAGVAVATDATAWIARARRKAPHAFVDLFRGWPLALWIAAAALHPDLPWRIAAGAIGVEHAALLLTTRRLGRVIAGDPQ